MEQTAELVSVQVGQPVRYPAEGPDEPEWYSAIVKTPLSGPVWLDRLGLLGDAQADRKAHGGPQRAVNVYPVEHYDYWRTRPGLEAISRGGFGENFTVRGLLEDTVCIGDVFRVGEALVQVSQPRGPCYKLNRRWHVRELMEQAVKSGRVGWYFRVLEPGNVQAGDTIERIEHLYPEWTVARVWSLKLDPGDSAALRSLAEVPPLSEDWRAGLLKR